jgi:hypothetical protein
VLKLRFAEIFWMCLLELLGETGRAAHTNEEQFPLSVRVFQYRNNSTISIKFGIEPKLCVSVHYTALLCLTVTLRTSLYVIYLLRVMKLYLVPKYIILTKSTQCEIVN